MTQGNVSKVLSALSDWPGYWQGHGLNHEGQQFQATLVARRLFESSNFLLWFRAAGLGGERYHEEISLLGQGQAGELALVSANTNIPYLQHFDSLPSLSASFLDSEALSLHHGDHSRADGFRETISLSLCAADELRYSFAWAMPGETVKDRSSAILIRKEGSVSNSPIR